MKMAIYKYIWARANITVECFEIASAWGIVWLFNCTNVWNILNIIPAEGVCFMHDEKQTNKIGASAIRNKMPILDAVYWDWNSIWIWHYSGTIMSMMASEITGVLIVYSTVCSGADQRKQISASLACVREFTGELPPQRASNEEDISIWWRHHGM